MSFISCTGSEEPGSLLAERFIWTGTAAGALYCCVPLARASADIKWGNSFLEDDE